MNRGILTTRIGSEFAGVPYEEQLAKLQEGKRILNEHGIYTDIFSLLVIATMKIRLKLLKNRF